MFAEGKITKVLVFSITTFTMLLLAWWSWQSVPGYKIEPGFWAVEKAFLNQQSGMMVEVDGKVVRILTADQEGSHHQNFVIRMRNGQSVLVSHSIAAAHRVPISIDDEVTVRGEYQWTEPGGAIHWTHRDFSPERRHGWIEHQGKKYD